jgi:hypothetical protein
MKELSVPFIKPHIPPERQQEAVLTAVLNIQAHVMTMASFVMNIEALLIKPEKKPTDTVDPTIQFYRGLFYEYARKMQVFYRDYGEIETL